MKAKYNIGVASLAKVQLHITNFLVDWAPTGESKVLCESHLSSQKLRFVLARLYCRL